MGNFESAARKNINANRIINITSNSGDGTRSWKYNLSSLIGNDNKLDKLFNLSDLDVTENIKLLMDKDPKVFKTNNEFGYPVNDFLSGQGGSLGKVGSLVGKGLDVLGTVYDIGSVIGTALNNNDDVSKTWQPWGKDIIAWKGSRGGLEFEYEFNFRLGQYGIWNAYEEIVKPVLNLVAPAIPRGLDALSMTGPFPNIWQLLARMIGGVFNNNSNSSNTSDSTTKFTGTMESVGNKINDILISSYKNYTFNVKFGNMMTFNKMIVTNAEANFSNKVDQEGWPISGSAKLTFQGMIPLALTYGNESSSSGTLLSARFG